MLAKVSQWLCASLKKSEAPVFDFAKAKFTLRFCPLVVGVWTDPDVPHTEYNEGVLFCTALITFSTFWQNSSISCLEVGA